MKENEKQPQVVPAKKARSSSRSGIGSLLRKIGGRRVTPLLQMTEVECGLTCLAMILTYYGRKTSVSELRARFGGGRDGFSALGLVKAARTFGLRVRAISLQKSEFRHVSLPAIVHWEFNHFLVVERWSAKHISVVDPAGGRKRLTKEEFDAGFTGIVITFEPGANFSRQAPKSPISLRALVLQANRQAPGAILQVLGASVLLQIFGLALPIMTKVIIDQILPHQMDHLMDVIAIGIVMVLLSQGITTLLREWLLVYLRARIDIQIMLGFFEHLLSLPYGFFQQRSNGDLLARVGSNTVIRDTLSNQMIATFLDSSMVIAYLAILLSQSIIFGLLALGIGLLQVFVMIITYRPVCELANRELAAQGKAQGYMSEALAGIATLKAAGAEDRAHDRWTNLFFDQLNISVRHGYLSAVISTVMTILRTLSPLALLWTGTMLTLNHTLEIGTMLALNTLAAAFLAPLASLVNGGQQLQLVHAHLERLADVVTAEPEQNSQQVYMPPRLRGHIRLENVGFQYAPDMPKVLHALNVTITPGQKVAIVGRTGTGKSTLGKLLLGLYIPTEGQIYYDGIPLRSLRFQEVRRQFGVVMQDAAIFSGTIMQNITLNNPHMSLEEVIKASKIAAIHDDIMAMPMGYDTYVAEGGSALSGGQRQRLAIARAVAHNPSILLLDEATSSLDVLTEQRVAQHLQEIACTQVIIAHRLSTIRNADLILVLDGGTLVEGGTHENLLRHGGYYARLIQQQIEQSERRSGLHRLNWRQTI
jgi:ATP-binding cassette subfamily B protein